MDVELDQALLEFVHKRELDTAEK